jgi:hypothetical protein
VAWRCGAPRAARDAARKPWEAAFGRAGDLPGASGNLDDAPHRLRLPSCPADRPRDLYGSLSTKLGIKRGFGHIDMGVYAEVIGGGEIATGDRITLA